MITIQLANTALILGGRPIFTDLTWSIQHDQKIGLIGPNGAGKSSLFKLMVGEYTPEPGGNLIKAKGSHAGLPGSAARTAFGSDGLGDRPVRQPALACCPG